MPQFGIIIQYCYKLFRFFKHFVSFDHDFFSDFLDEFSPFLKFILQFSKEILCWNKSCLLLYNWKYFLLLFSKLCNKYSITWRCYFVVYVSVVTVKILTMFFSFFYNWSITPSSFFSGCSKDPLFLILKKNILLEKIKCIEKQHPHALITWIQYLLI